MKRQWLNDCSSMLSHPGRPNNHASPAGQCHVIIILQSPAHSPISYTFLALFQLLQQPKVTGNFDACLGRGFKAEEGGTALSSTRFTSSNLKMFHDMYCWVGLSY